MLVCRAIACWATALLIIVATNRAYAGEDQSAPAPDRESQFQETAAPFITQFCGDCHSGAKAEKGLSLTEFRSAQSLIDNRTALKKIVAKLRAHAMPPKDAPQPSPQQYDTAVRLLGDIQADAARNAPHDPGRVTMRRLNRAEYNNTIHDLLGIDFYPADDFPTDDVGYGFDNNGDVLSLTPLLLEKYLTSAEQAVSLSLKHDPAQSPSDPYRRIMIADPANLGPNEAARQIIRHFADRAFRRPLDDDELNRLMQLFAATDRANEQLDRRLQPVLTAILVSPRFLFRVELDPPSAESQSTRPLDDWELASRISYFLWSSMPDDELFDLTRRGQLRAQLPAQVHRMLHDPKSKALVENFSDQWLQTRRLNSMSPDAKQFPKWNSDLRTAMHQEATSLFAYIIAEDRSLLELIDAPYTFLNQPLAEFYGIDGVQGDEFRRVDLPAASPRGGVITLAAVLTVTSNPDRTSPVKRGKWILENILGTPPPPPPPDVPTLAARHGGKSIATVRQQTEQHRADPRCASCHSEMDPLGFGLENFDAIGRYSGSRFRFRSLEH